MSSSKFETKQLTASWSNIEAWIIAGLTAFKGLPEGKDVVALKFDYPGGYISHNRKMNIEVIMKEQGVDAFYLDDTQLSKGNKVGEHSRSSKTKRSKEPRKAQSAQSG